MRREWKPGDVAMVTCSDGEERRGMFLPSLFGEHEGSWKFGDGLLRPVAISDARPLVVIDPEDRAQVELLFQLWEAQTGDDFSAIQAALREFADPRPPKPAEPTGLGAVVEDADGALWLRWETADRHTRPWCVEGAILPNRRYDEIAAVRVLSEGVTR